MPINDIDKAKKAIVDAKMDPEELKRRGKISLFNDLSILFVERARSLEEWSHIHPETLAVIGQEMIELDYILYRLNIELGVGLE